MIGDDDGNESIAGELDAIQKLAISSTDFNEALSSRNGECVELVSAASSEVMFGVLVCDEFQALGVVSVSVEDRNLQLLDVFINRNQEDRISATACNFQALIEHLA
jgi:hypothetical protein